MGVYVANQVIKLMIKKGQKIEGAKVLILGITFEENCPEIRNSKMIDVINELMDFSTIISVYNPWADADEVRQEYRLELMEKDTTPDFSQYQAIILTVAHDKFISPDFITANSNQVIYDVKSTLDCADATL